MKSVLATLLLLFFVNNIVGTYVVASVPMQSQNKSCINRSFLSIDHKEPLPYQLVASNFNKTPPTHWNENDHTTGFHIGGFALGLFLPIAGIFIANLIGGKAKKNRKKWAIIGSAVTVGLILIIIKSLSTKY